MAAACLLLAQGARAQDDSIALTPSPRLKPAPATDAARREAPVYLRADEISGQPSTQVQAQGRVELRHAGVVLRADQLRYDLAEDLTRLGIGEAMVTLLDEDGVPTPVAWTRLRPPASQIGAVDPAAVEAAAAADPLMPTYATAVDPASAHEAISAISNGESDGSLLKSP